MPAARCCGTAGSGVSRVGACRARQAGIAGARRRLRPHENAQRSAISESSAGRAIGERVVKQRPLSPEGLVKPKQRTMPGLAVRQQHGIRRVLDQYGWGPFPWAGFRLCHTRHVRTLFSN